MKNLLVSLWLIGSVTCAVVLAEQVNKEIDLYQSEDRCIKAFMQLGIERRDIEAKDGGCYVKG
jgi:hypothetical protein